MLHVRELPTFGRRLSERDSELLVQYLTAPYLRIPLLLDFFADEARVHALDCKELQVCVGAIGCAGLGGACKRAETV